MITILIFSVFILNPSLNQYSNRLFQKSLDSVQLESYDNLGFSGQSIFTKQWLNNTSFNDPIEPTWFPTYGELGDKFDVNATTSPGQANFEILGETNTFSDISGTPLSSDWTKFHNPQFPLYPDTSTINSEGCYVSHTFAEGADQFPSVHWERNVSMPVDMADYIITSASLSAVVNATVTASPGDWGGGGIEAPGDATGSGSSQNYTWDYARFYVLLSDLTKEKVYEVAYNQTIDLGKDSAGSYDYMTDTFMTIVPEEDLIFYLTSVISSDFQNFTVTLGIRIWCEDNWVSDRDIWNDLLIKSCNLMFTYERKIDQFTSVSWNQDAGKISDVSNDTVIVNEANLNFKYKIDNNWTESSLNSEIKILINDNPHTETIKLSSANTSFQEAKVGGFDVTSLITDDVNLSIQIFLADEFELNQTMIVSIDDVTLNITYTIIFPDKETDLHLFLNNENKTLDPYFQVNVGEQVNITIKYLNKTHSHIPNATVTLSGNFTGILDENEIFEHYSVIINIETSDIGINFLTIIAQALNHEIAIINPIITVNKFNSENLQLILNNENKTSDPNLELIVGEQLNITVKYTNLLGAHIQGASVLLTSETLTQNLEESSTLESYSLIINTTEKLKIGVNLLTIEAQESNYETQIINVRVSIRKINLEITTLSGSNKLDRRPGDNANIKIILNNTDFGGNTTGAIVMYVSELGNGILTDSDNDGIYEMTFHDLPDGIFTIIITAIAGDQYYIQDFEISLNVFIPEEEFVIFQILMGTGIAAAVLIAGYLYAYQKVLKYPKPVRKVRKYRKALTKEKDPGVRIIDRKISFNNIFQKEVNKSSKFLKGKPVKQITKPEQIIKKPIESSKN
jgi:hypothetical protein